jgi:hypothetical protein
MVGLGVTETGANWRDIDYGFRSSSGALEIRESGTWIASSGTLAVDDVLTIAVMGSMLEYRLNGIPLYSRSIAGDEDFYIDSSFKSGGITLENVVIGTN